MLSTHGINNKIMVKIFKGSSADYDLNRWCSVFGYKIVQVISSEADFWETHIITVLLEKDK